MSPEQEAYLEEVKDYARESGRILYKQFSREMSAEDARALRSLHEELAEENAKLAIAETLELRQFRSEEVDLIEQRIDLFLDEVRLKREWLRSAAKGRFWGIIRGGVDAFMPLVKDLAASYGLKFIQDIGGRL